MQNIDERIRQVCQIGEEVSMREPALNDRYSIKRLVQVAKPSGESPQQSPMAFNEIAGDDGVRGCRQCAARQCIRDGMWQNGAPRPAFLSEPPPEKFVDMTIER